MPLQIAPGQTYDNIYDLISDILDFDRSTEAGEYSDYYYKGGIITIGTSLDQDGNINFTPVYNLGFVFSGILLCIFVSSVFKLIGITLKGLFGQKGA